MHPPAQTDRAVAAVVFDIGNVLVVWDPRLLYRKLTHDEVAIDAFLRDVCTSEWNHRLDLGASWDELVAELTAAHPDQREWIAAYQHRWDEMLGGTIEEAVAALRCLRAASVPVYGLSNFAAHTWTIAVERHPVLRELDDVILSAEVGLAKPDPAIYDLAARRFGVTPSATLFVDDRADNVAAAAAAGWRTHQFTDPAGLYVALERMGLPTPTRQR